MEKVKESYTGVFKGATGKAHDGAKAGAQLGHNLSAVSIQDQDLKETHAMAIHLETKTPNKLHTAFKKAIDDGHIISWSYDKDGDFTHTPEQWVKKAWLRPRVTKETRLSFYILPPKDTAISSEVYAIYHGRFIESMLQHCDSLFTEARATAMPEANDNVS